MARTFVDAHAQDWCEVLHEDGDDEFSLTALRTRCGDLTTASDPDAETACNICTRFAAWFVVDSEPDEAASPELALPAVCSVLAGKDGIEAESEGGDTDRRDLAARWCTATSGEMRFSGIDGSTTVSAVVEYTPTTWRLQSWSLSSVESWASGSDPGDCQNAYWSDGTITTTSSGGPSEFYRLGQDITVASNRHEYVNEQYRDDGGSCGCAIPCLNPPPLCAICRSAREDNEQIEIPAVFSVSQRTLVLGLAMVAE